MTFNSQKLALSAAGSIAIWYTFCFLTCWLWPKESLQLIAQLIHVSSLEHLEPYMSFTFLGYISGLIQNILYVYLFVWPMAAIYNALVRK